MCPLHTARWVEGWTLTLDKKTDAGWGLLEDQAGLLGAKGKDQLLGRRDFPACGLGWLGFEFPLCGQRPVYNLSVGTSTHVRGC